MSRTYRRTKSHDIEDNCTWFYDQENHVFIDHVTKTDYPDLYKKIKALYLSDRTKTMNMAPSHFRKMLNRKNRRHMKNKLVSEVKKTPYDAIKEDGIKSEASLKKSFRDLLYNYW